MIYELNMCQFYMCDFSGLEFKDEGIGVNCGMHNNTDKIPYNDLSVTEVFCKANNLNNITLVDSESDEINKLNSIDLVYSFHCIGYHWSIEESFHKYNLEQIISENCTLIFGSRKKGNLLNEPEVIGSFKRIKKINGLFLEDFLIYQKV